MQSSCSRKQRRHALWLPLLVALAAACASVPPQYDQTTDAAISALQKEIDTQLVQWISLKRAGDPASLAKATYQANIDFYNKVEVDLTSLELRMEAVPDKSTQKLPEFFSNIRTELSNLQTQHKEGPLSEIVLTATRNQMNAQFAVLMTYELSLKGVSSSSKSSTDSTATSTAAAKKKPG